MPYLEQYKAHVGVLDQASKHCKIASLVLWVLVAHGAGVAASEQPVHVKTSNQQRDDALLTIPLSDRYNG